MFAQANSEHCRHKIFNADWIIDGEPQAEPVRDDSQYSRSASARHGGRVCRQFVHYRRRDRVAVLSRRTTAVSAREDTAHILMKVETHNHPTAISPFPGAATGAGGEIRDEGATGTGAQTEGRARRLHASNLRIPDAAQPGRPTPTASPIASPRLCRSCRTVRSAPHRSTMNSDVRTCRLFPHVRDAGRRRDARLPQADHDRRRRRQYHGGATCTRSRSPPERCSSSSAVPAC